MYAPGGGVAFASFGGPLSRDDVDANEAERRMPRGAALRGGPYAPGPGTMAADLLVGSCVRSEVEAKPAEAGRWERGEAVASLAPDSYAPGPGERVRFDTKRDDVEPNDDERRMRRPLSAAPLVGAYEPGPGEWLLCGCSRSVVETKAADSCRRWFAESGEGEYVPTPGVSLCLISASNIRRRSDVE